MEKELSILQIQALQDARVSDDAYEAVCTFNMRLLSHKSGGRNTLMDNLVKTIKDSSLEAKADSRLTILHNSRGQMLERHAVIQLERGLLCEVVPAHEKKACMVFLRSKQRY